VATGSTSRTKHGCSLPKDVKGQINKRLLFETLLDNWLDEVLVLEAILEATEAKKYENN
jgi:hypothetical protein